jgi:thiamine biosynthesis lipoprotein
LSQVASQAFPALGTTAAVLVTDAESLTPAVTILRDELESIDRACSRFRDDSELAWVNRSAGEPVRASERLLEAVGVAIAAAVSSDGAVDPTVGRAMRLLGYDRDFREIGSQVAQLEQVRATSGIDWRAVELDVHERTVRVPAGVELDLGATAKALCADRAATTIHRRLGTGALVSLGGDITTAGKAPGGGWIVRVTDDHASDAAAAGQTISISSGGLATSSTTVRRWQTDAGEAHHIVDPRTGEPALEVWRTATVTARSCVDANTASTLAIVRGEGAPAWLRAHRLPSRLVRPSGEVTLVGDWPQETQPGEEPL